MRYSTTILALAALAMPLAAQQRASSGKPVQGTSQVRTASTVFKLQRYTVGLRPGVDIATLASDLGIQCVGQIGFDNLYELEGAAGATFQQSKALLKALALDPRTRFAEPSRSLRTPEGQACMAPGSVSGLPCTISFYDGSPSPEKFYDQPLGPAIDLARAQTYLTGEKAIVAVIDTGIDATHPLLAGRLAAPGYDFINDIVGAVDAGDGLDNDLDGLVDEALGHGTHIAGTILLINPDALILPLRVLDSDGNGNSFDVAEAIYYAVANGADIINLSLGMSTPSKAVIDALEFADHLEVEVYAAAGNTGKLGAQFPASYKTVLSVSAVDDFDSLAPFATFGPTVDVTAPGVDIYSSMPGNTWAWWSGTSMATSVASGLGSMLCSIEGESGDGPKEIIDNALPIDPLNPGLGGLMGAGRIDAGETVTEMFD